MWEGSAAAGYGPPQGSYEPQGQQHWDPQMQHGQQPQYQEAQPGYYQEPPPKRFKGDGFKGDFKGKGKGKSIRSSGDPTEVGEVRFYSQDSARRAVDMLDNSSFMGMFISVSLDNDVTKVLVTSMPAGIAWQELKDHFGQAGEVHYANIGRSSDAVGGKGFHSKGFDSGGGGEAKGFGVAEHGRPCVGEVRFYSKEDADRAIELFNGKAFRDSVISVRPDLSSFQGTKLLVFNVPVGTEWTDLRDHFVQAGQLAFCGIDAALKGKGKHKGPPPVQNFAPAGPQPGFAAARPAPASAWSSKGQPGPMYGDGNMGGGPEQSSSSSGAHREVGEVRFDSAETAQQAIALLNGSAFNGSTLSVVQDGGCRDGSRVLVFGVPPDADRQDIKVHFEQAGRVEFCGWKGKGHKGFGKDKGPKGFDPGFDQGFGKAGGKDKGGPRVSSPELLGEVRFTTSEGAEEAIRQVNGTLLNGSPISVELDATCRDTTRVVVDGVPPGVSTHALREHFEPVGQVAFAGYRPRYLSHGKGHMQHTPAPAAPAHQGYYAAPGYAAPAAHASGYDHGAMQHNDYGQYHQAAPQQPAPPPPAGPTQIGEVIYNSTAEANQAVQLVSGSRLRGTHTLSVSLDASAMGGGTLTVYNLPHDCTTEELQAHFVDSGVTGAPPFVAIHEGSAPPPPPV